MLGARAAPWLSLLAAAAACALVLLYGPVAGEAIAAAIGAVQPVALELVFTGTIYGALLVLALAGGGLTKIPVRSAPDRGTMPCGFAKGAGIGVIGFAAAAALAAISGSLGRGVPGDANLGLLAIGALVVLTSAAVEEILFRGWLQSVLVVAWGPVAGIAVAAFAFAALHVAGGARSPLTLANLLLGGLVFGLLAWRLNLAAAAGAHGAWNLVERIGLGLDPNPGVGSFGAGIDLDLRGAAAWGGSDEGLNASLAVTAALLALLVPLMFRAKPRASPG